MERGKIISMRIILIGPPGSGKGTQAKRLAKKLGIQHISSGALFRNAAVQGSSLGKEAESYMKKGLLVPDELATGLVMERIKQSACKNGFILDGFPRNLSQAKALATALNEIIRPIQHVFVIELADEDVIARITGRRMDPESGNIYHMRFDPPPDEIKSRLIQRSDDIEETVKKRLVEYYNETLPILPFYAKKGILHRISGRGNLHVVENRLLEGLK